MTTTSDARKRRAEANNPHAACVPGQCREGQAWVTVGCAGRGGDVDESEARAGEVWQEADNVLLLCVAPGVMWGDFRGDRFAWDAPTIARPLRRLLDADGNLVAALAAQPAAPQPTEGGAQAAVARVEAARREWLAAHTGDEPDDEAMALYSVAYLECAHDIAAALRLGDPQ